MPQQDCSIIHGCQGFKTWKKASDTLPTKGKLHAFDLNRLCVDWNLTIWIGKLHAFDLNRLCVDWNLSEKYKEQFGSYNLNKV